MQKRWVRVVPLEVEAQVAALLLRELVLRYCAGLRFSFCFRPMTFLEGMNSSSEGVSSTEIRGDYFMSNDTQEDRFPSTEIEAIGGRPMKFGRRSGTKSQRQQNELGTA
jgi:hypothetical protein